jgi:hypothetical protein
MLHVLKRDEESVDHLFLPCDVVCNLDCLFQLF